MIKHLIYFILVVTVTAAAPGCSSRQKQPEHPLFEALDSKRTGIDFTNRLAYDQRFNLFKYIYFYNGSGVGAGDFNNDGKIDLFFASNQHQNQLYLNEGNLKFSNATRVAGIPADSAWSTGVSVVDINDDGLLDIYVCRVGNYEILHSQNQLLINLGPDANGIPHFRDSAAAYGLNFSGFSTQAAFFDYDNDGDLDMFLLNHSVHENGTFRPRADFLGTYHELSGDRIYRNDGRKFTDVTRTTGINSTAIGYGLGITLGDVDLDGYTDLYIGNDFHENDYLYINQTNGQFREEGEQRLMHTSQFSMGVDLADVNNDAYPEIISLDMLPSDPYILKRSLGEDAYDIFNYKISVGYSHQYTRNNLQFNRRNGMFSETGLYSGVAATDWSWAPLWMDFDNDGKKDLFISNGIPKRMNDIDYINFVSNSDVQQKIRTNNMQQKDLSLIEKFPEIKLPNKFFHNEGDLRFSDRSDSVSGNLPSFSNGAAYADLDNDGDLDLVVNNLEDAAMIYENKTVSSADTYLKLELKGAPGNIKAVGARLVLFTGSEVRTYEKFPVKGFLSSMEIPLQIGLANTKVDSMFLIWPDRSFEKIEPGKKGVLKLSWRTGLPAFDFEMLRREARPPRMLEDITAASGLSFLHTENHFVEFDREALIPHMVSSEGPALAVGDVNGDGLDDVFVGAARDKKSALWIQGPSGRFSAIAEPAIDQDSMFEDVDACWVDVNGDRHLDLLVASGGNEFYGNDIHNEPRLYLNDGQGQLTRSADALPQLFLTASCIRTTDVNADGFPDIFIGTRAVPWAYGAVPESHLLLNDGKGNFKDATATLAPDLAKAGFVCDAQWADLDGDKDQDLLLAVEWGSPVLFVNNNGRFTRRDLSDKSGWWNFVKAVDLDGDGDLDFIAGNLGENSRLKASEDHPVKMYFNDFDGNGRKEQVLTYFVGGKEVPFASKAELDKQLPIMKKKFLYAENFAKSNLSELFTKDKLDQSVQWKANYFSNAIFINEGQLRFRVVALPWQAQLSPMKDAAIVDANGDKLPDLILGGNYYDSNIEMGRYDADFGTLLTNLGQGRFSASPLPGLAIKGQVRHLRPLSVAGQPAWVVARNSDSLKLIRWKN